MRAEIGVLMSKSATVLLAGLAVGLVSTWLGKWGFAAFLAAICALLAAVYSFNHPFPLVICLLFLLPLHGFMMALLASIPSIRYWKEALLLTLGVTWGLRCLAAGRNGQPSRRLVTTDVMVLAYSLFMTSRTLVDGISDVDQYALPTYILYTVVYALVRTTATSERRIRIMMSTMVAAASLVSVGAIAQSLGGLSEFGLSAEAATRSGIRRASFSVGSSLVMGPYMVSALLTTWWLRDQAERRTARWFAGSLALMQCAALIMSGTRIAWVQAALSLVVICYYGFATARRPSAISAVLATSTVLAAVTVVSVLIVRVSSDLGLSSESARVGAWMQSLSTIASAPLTGAGPGSTLWATSSLRGSTFVTESYLLQLALESGLIGCLLFCGAYFSALHELTQVASSRRIEDAKACRLAQMMSAWLVGLVPVLLFAQSLNSWVMQAVFWCLLGTAVSTRFVLGACAASCQPSDGSSRN